MKKLKEKLNEKLSKNGGFTLIEMLIVVAIIAILIAISIPMVNSALERAREATDAANERAALGLAMVQVLSENKLGDTTITSTTTTASAYYQITNSRGSLVGGTSEPATGFDYGKGTFAGDVEASNVGKGIKVTYTAATDTEDEKYAINWE